MKVIHIVSNKVWGGGERYVLDLCRALRADGREVEVWCRPGTAPCDVFRREGFLAGTLPLGGMLDVRSVLRLASVMRGCKDGAVVHVHNFKDAATAVNARRLVGAPWHIRVVATRHLVKKARTDRLHTSMLRSLDSIIFVSRLAFDEFMSSHPAVDRHSLHVIHNAVDLPARRHKVAPDEPVRLVFAGRIAPEKGLEVLLDALTRIRRLPWTLDVAGTGDTSYVAGLCAEAERRDIADRVAWLGHMADVQEALVKSDVCVLPSVVREACPMVILEAWSCGVPVVTTNNGAQSELVDDGRNGLLVAPGDSSSLAGALERLITDRTLMESMSADAAEAYSSRFSYPRFLNRIKSIYGLD